MEIKDNFNLFGLFVEKRVKIIVDKKYFHVNTPSIKDFYTKDSINALYHLMIASKENIMQVVPIQCTSSYNFLHLVLFEFGMYKEFGDYVGMIKDNLPFFLPELEIDYKNKSFICNNITITEEI
jgi:hypothetical protein